MIKTHSFSVTLHFSQRSVQVLDAMYKSHASKQTEPVVPINEK
jgi:hypothetical protein